MLAAYGAAESSIQAEGYLAYADVLRMVVYRLGITFGFTPTSAEREVLVEGIVSWPLFSDTVEVLAGLAAQCPLGILSNVDDALIAPSIDRMGVEFAHLITAEQVRSYKPAPAHFEEVLRRTGLEPGQVLHVAQSRFHDIGVAASLGFDVVWIDRRGDGSGGATPVSHESIEGVPTFPTLADFVDWILAA